jgi:hypothetical protein
MYIEVVRNRMNLAEEEWVLKTARPVFVISRLATHQVVTDLAIKSKGVSCFDDICHLSVRGSVRLG